MGVDLNVIVSILCCILSFRCTAQVSSYDKILNLLKGDLPYSEVLVIVQGLGGTHSKLIAHIRNIDVLHCYSLNSKQRSANSFHRLSSSLTSGAGFLELSKFICAVAENAEALSRLYLWRSESDNITISLTGENGDIYRLLHVDNSEGFVQTWHVAKQQISADNHLYSVKRHSKLEENKSDPCRAHLIAEFESKRRKRAVNKVPVYYKQFIDKTTYYLELALVYDNSMYIKYGRKLETLYSRSKQLVNIINSIYHPLNIKILLAGVEVWTDKDRINITDPVDPDSLLQSFMLYRKLRLNSVIPNDNAQFITDRSFTGGVVGKAQRGSLCSADSSGGVNMDHSRNPIPVATTIAHELGHSFGMEHDGETCRCAEIACIMSPSSSASVRPVWSMCSLEYLQWGLKHGAALCLTNVPEKLPYSSCGNGITEPGEDCDCGMPEVCDNRCCNATTCKFTAGAVCATGGCCDQSQCKLLAATTECRSAATECDLAEYCDGTSEFCPRDFYKHNGLDCQNGKAYCYNGTCRTRDDQCRFVWGESGYSSPDVCYEENVKNYTMNANCGIVPELNETFYACAQEDIFCGRLHCVQKNEKTEIGDRSVTSTGHMFIPTALGVTAICHEALIDLGPEVQDPGMVPNGASCGADKMCFNAKCTAVKEVLEVLPCASGCSNRGICNSIGQCHCYAGYNPATNCRSAGLGGSKVSGPVGPGSNSDVIIAVVVFVFVVLPLLSVSIVLIYRNRDRLATKLDDYPALRNLLLSFDGGRGTKQQKRVAKTKRSLPVKAQVAKNATILDPNAAWDNTPDMVPPNAAPASRSIDTVAYYVERKQSPLVSVSIHHKDGDLSSAKYSARGQSSVSAPVAVVKPMPPAKPAPQNTPGVILPQRRAPAPPATDKKASDKESLATSIFSAVGLQPPSAGAQVPNNEHSPLKPKQINAVEQQSKLTGHVPSVDRSGLSDTESNSVLRDPVPLQRSQSGRESLQRPKKPAPPRPKQPPSALLKDAYDTVTVVRKTESSGDVAAKQPWLSTETGASSLYSSAAPKVVSMGEIQSTLSHSARTLQRIPETEPLSTSTVPGGNPRAKFNTLGRAPGSAVKKSPSLISAPIDPRIDGQRVQQAPSLEVVAKASATQPRVQRAKSTVGSSHLRKDRSLDGAAASATGPKVAKVKRCVSITEASIQRPAVPPPPPPKPQSLVSAPQSSPSTISPPMQPSLATAIRNPEPCFGTSKNNSRSPTVALTSKDSSSKAPLVTDDYEDDGDFDDDDCSPSPTPEPVSVASAATGITQAESDYDVIGTPRREELKAVGAYNGLSSKLASTPATTTGFGGYKSPFGFRVPSVYKSTVSSPPEKLNTSAATSGAMKKLVNSFTTKPDAVK